MFRYIPLLVLLLLTGCEDFLSSPSPPPQLSVTYITDPPGAVLYDKGIRQGFTPLTLYYNLDRVRKASGNIAEVTVRWQSGATATAKAHIDLTQGLFWNQNIPRPNNVPGREADEQFGLQTESLRQQKESQEQQQMLNILLLQQQQLQVIQQVTRPPPAHNSINCTSNAIGSTVFTNCN